MKESIEYISLGFSILAVLGTLLGYLLHNKRLKDQEAKLNAYQLKRYEEEAMQERKAEIRANVVKGERGHCIVKIYNKGKAKATNVRLVMDEEGFLVRNKAFPKPFINPQESAEFHIHLTTRAPDSLLLTIQWEDDFSTENEHQQILDF